MKNMTFVAALSGLFAVIGVIMWYLDAVVAIGRFGTNSNAQLGALEGLVMAIIGGAAVTIASVPRLTNLSLRRPKT